MSPDIRTKDRCIFVARNLTNNGRWLHPVYKLAFEQAADLLEGKAIPRNPDDIKVYLETCWRDQEASAHFRELAACVLYHMDPENGDDE